MLIEKPDRVVHYPANPDKFEFDSEVADVFPDMARRSIPLFYETHGIHAEMCRDLIEAGQNRILDVGASRGAFIQALYDWYGPQVLDVTTIENSPYMIEHLEQDYPHARHELCDLSSREFLRDMRTFDIINMSYVLQFIPPALQPSVVTQVVRMLRPGGLLFVGAKLAVHGQLGKALHEQYISWRMTRGYTREEIDAKTKALASSMWPWSEDHLTSALRGAGIYDIARTTSYTVFANYVCTKEYRHD